MHWLPVEELLKLIQKPTLVISKAANPIEIAFLRDELIYAYVVKLKRANDTLLQIELKILQV